MTNDYSTVFQVARRFLKRAATIGELRQAVRACEAREYRARLKDVRVRMLEVQERGKDEA